MSIGSRIESKGMFAASVFYLAAGILFLVLLPLSGFAPHIGLLGIFSLIAAYGLLKKRSWSFWLVLILLFGGTTFASFTIYSFLMKDYILGTLMIAYLILTWVFTVYTATRRKNLEG